MRYGPRQWCNLRAGVPHGEQVVILDFNFLILPQYIIMAMHARPAPGDPYNPAAEARHPSPFVPIRLRVFAPVMWLNDWVVRVVSVGGGGKAKGHKRGMSELLSCWFSIQGFLDHSVDLSPSKFYFSTVSPTCSYSETRLARVLGGSPVLPSSHPSSLRPTIPTTVLTTNGGKSGLGS